MAEEIGTWTVNYLPDRKTRLTGKLLVTDEDVRFRAMYDSSFKTIAKNIGLAAGSLAATGGNLVYLNEEGSEAEIVVPRGSIAESRPAKKGMMKRVVVATTDGTEFVFEYGLLSTAKIVDAING